MEGNCPVNNVVNKWDMQRENGRAISITKSYHLNTRHIPTGQHFQVTCGTLKVFTPNFMWSVLKRVQQYSNILKKCLLY